MYSLLEPRPVRPLHTDHTPSCAHTCVQTTAHRSHAFARICARTRTCVHAHARMHACTHASMYMRTQASTHASTTRMAIGSNVCMHIQPNQMDTAHKAKGEDVRSLHASTYGDDRRRAYAHACVDARMHTHHQAMNSAMWLRTCTHVRRSALTCACTRKQSNRTQHVGRRAPTCDPCTQTRMPMTADVCMHTQASDN